MSLATGLTALGSTQADALPLPAKYNYFSTVAASTGTILPSAAPMNTEIFVRNGGASAISVYPPVGGRINGGAVNSPATSSGGNTTRYVHIGDGLWWQF